MKYLKRRFIIRFSIQTAWIFSLCLMPLQLLVAGKSAPPKPPMVNNSVVPPPSDSMKHLVTMLADFAPAPPKVTLHSVKTVEHIIGKKSINVLRDVGRLQIECIFKGQHIKYKQFEAVEFLVAQGYFKFKKNFGLIQIKKLPGGGVTQAILDGSGKKNRKGVPQSNSTSNEKESSYNSGTAEGSGDGKGTKGTGSHGGVSPGNGRGEHKSKKRLGAGTETTPKFTCEVKTDTMFGYAADSTDKEKKQKQCLSEVKAKESACITKCGNNENCKANCKEKCAEVRKNTCNINAGTVTPQDTSGSDQ